MLAYPLSQLRKQGGFVQFDFAGEPYLLLLRGSYQASVYSRRLGSEVLSFQIRSHEPFRFEDISGTIWNDLAQAVSGQYAGQSLSVPADSYLTEWSDWIMEHPGSEIWSQ